MTKTFTMRDVYQRLLESENWQVLIGMSEVEHPNNCTFHCQYEGDNRFNNYEYNKVYEIDVYIGASGKVVMLVNE